MKKQNSTDKSRPVEGSDLEIVGTFQDAGTRPVEESPDLLVPDREITKNSPEPTSSQKSSSQLDINSIPPLD